MKQKETFLCIDLKSFYASVECVERGLDPFTTNLVVADPDRSVSTICLAITPAMKKLGIRNRCRIHEIPDHIEYIVAKPRMQLYMEYSARIYGIYLNYVAKEDIHVYSVDECFMDVTRYLSLYHLTEKEMAQKLMDAVMEETGITATAGIGTNLYLAKIAMGDIALASIQSEDWLYKMFGIDAELLIDHAWGCESCKMSDIKNYHTEEHSLSNGQVLMRNYTFEEAAVVVREMTDVLVLDLVEKGLVTNSVTLWIAYDHRFEREPSKGTVRFPDRTNCSKEMIDTVEALYRKIADPHTGIRRIEIIANKITPEGYQQYTLFQDSIKAEKERHLQEAVLQVKKRYGKNAIMRGSNLLECSTYRERNNQVGGHRA